MSLFRNIRTLSLAGFSSLTSLYAGAALLVAVAVFFGAMPTPELASVGQTQVAATALGDVQGVPQGFTGYKYPDYTDCYINYSSNSYGPEWGPVCLNEYGNVYGGNFYAGVFSVHPADSMVGKTLQINASAGPSIPQTISKTYVGAIPSIELRCSNGTPPQQYYGDNGEVGYYCSDGDSGGPPVEYQPTCTETYATPPGAAYVTEANGAQGYACYATTYTVSSYVHDPSVGTQPSVVAGGQLTLEWSCLSYRHVMWEAKGGQGYFDEGGWLQGEEYTVSPVATGASGIGPGFSPSGLTGMRTITAPAAPGTYTYSLTCEGPYNLPTMSIPVTVTPLVSSDVCPNIEGVQEVVPAGYELSGGQCVLLPPGGGPAVSFTVNGSHDVTVVPGDTLNYSWATVGGTLPLTATSYYTDNGGANIPLGSTVPTGTDSEQVQESWVGHTYVNTVTVTDAQGRIATDSATVRVVETLNEGPTLSYTFSNGSTSLVASPGDQVDEVWNTTGGTEPVTAVSYYTDNGGPQIPLGSTAPNGTYTNNVGTDWAGHVYVTTITVTDAEGRTDSKSTTISVPDVPTCTDPNAIPPSCVCDTANGWSGPNGGPCIKVPGLSLTAAQYSVRNGNPAVLYWNVSNLDAEVTCSVSSFPDVFYAGMPPGTASTWSGSAVETGPITAQTVFTLSCTNANSVSITINQIPNVIEI